MWRYTLMSSQLTTTLRIHMDMAKPVIESGAPNLEAVYPALEDDTT